jgi:hypothetical protein
MQPDLPISTSPLHRDNFFLTFTKSIEKIFATMAQPRENAKAKRTSESPPFQHRGTFPFTKLPFEMQKEVFQYLLVPANDQVICPEKARSIENASCYKQTDGAIYWPSLVPASSSSLPCYHKTLMTQLLTVSHNVNAVAVQVLYGCNRFHVSIQAVSLRGETNRGIQFSSASLFNKFTDTISSLGVQSLRYLAIDFPLALSL